MHITRFAFNTQNHLWIDVYFKRGLMEYEATVIYQVEDWEEGNAYIPYYVGTHYMSEVSHSGIDTNAENADSLGEAEIECLTEQIYSKLNLHRERDYENA